MYRTSLKKYKDVYVGWFMAIPHTDLCRWGEVLHKHTRKHFYIFSLRLRPLHSKLLIYRRNVVTMKAESLHAKVMFRYVATCRTICVQMLCLTRSSNLIHAHVGNLILVHIENIAVYLQVMLQLFMFLQLFLKSLFTLLFTLYLLMVMNQKFTSKVCVKWLIDILKIFSVVVFMYLFLLKHTCIEVLEKIIHGNTLH